MFDPYQLAWPLVRRIAPERAHRLTISLLKSGLVPGSPPMASHRLRTRVWGLDFANPLGLAAGFDKNAEVADAMLRLGFGFVEVGTVTPRPQSGNPSPRVFRLIEDGALINRLGFNNQGFAAAVARLMRRQAAADAGRAGRGGIVGANIGPNRDSADPIADCVEGIRCLGRLADYLVLNVSSPNTPGLRDLQRKDRLHRLLDQVLAARRAAGLTTPILIKIAPDETPESLAAIAQTALDSGIDGIIATNTTITRPGTLRSIHRREAGGLSGRPLFQRSTEVLAELRALTNGTIPLIGVGGIASAADAYAKIRAGASLIQFYTGLVYRGPRLIVDILNGLVARLEADGFDSVAAAVGVAAKPA